MRRRLCDRTDRSVRPGPGRRRAHFPECLCGLVRLAALRVEHHLQLKSDPLTCSAIATCLSDQAQRQHRKGCSCLRYPLRVLSIPLGETDRLEPALDECQGMMNAAFTTIGVVPIFVNAVPALVPTLVAAFST